MRLGPLVYLLPLYSPLRMIEEICMLDHLSHGRFEPGVGRGVSPFELKFHKVDHDESRDIFIDAFKCVSAGLTTDSLTYTGKYYSYENVPIVLRPLQQPHPAFWYASSSPFGATWGGEQVLRQSTDSSSSAGLGYSVCLSIDGSIAAIGDKGMSVFDGAYVFAPGPMRLAIP